MAFLIIFGAIALGLLIFDLVAVTLGADSRPGLVDDRHLSGYRTV